MNEILEQIGAVGLIPVAVLGDAAQAVPAASALLRGGVPVMEVTLRTPAALESMERIGRSCPALLLGAGTVLNLDQCRRSVDAGARFIVTPGYDQEIVRWCQTHQVAVLPGCVTPTEIMTGLKAGIATFKYFPADLYGGLNGMKALSGPFRNVKFVPTGGIGQENLAQFAASPFIHAVGGSWLCPAKEIAHGAYDAITAVCQDAVRTVAACRIGGQNHGTSDPN